MKAKAIREQREAEEARKTSTTLGAARTSGPGITQGVKRSFSSMVSAASSTPGTLRDGRANNASASSSTSTTTTTTATATTTDRPLDAIRPARNFTKYVEYDFSKMTDTKGGFLTEEDDPHNRALNVRDDNDKTERKPANMTQKEWERQQLLKSLRQNRAGPFEPGLSVFQEKAQQKACRECGSLEIDWKWEEVFKCCVCHACKEKFPEKYSLLTKTEAREDYLLTERE